MRKIRLYNAVFILLLSIVLLGCSDDYITNDYRKETLDLDNAPLIVLEAQDFVNNLDFPVQTLNLENRDTVSFNNKHSTRSVTANSLSINWLSYVTSEDNDYDIAIIPVQDELSTAFVQITKYGRSKKSINKVIKKLIVRRSKETGDLTVVLGTYICERNYYDNYNDELASLGYDFTDSDFSGYFIASRLDGSMLSGKYIQKGEEQFRFIKNPVPYSECSDSVSDTQIHLFLNLSSSAVSLSTRSVVSNSASVLSLDQQEETGSFYCSFCHKPADDCTCFVIVACKKCGKNVVNCTCDDNICQLCGGLIVAGHCDCCDICHKTPCECSDNNDNNSGNSGGSSGSSSGGGGGGGTSIGGGNSNNNNGITNATFSYINGFICVNFENDILKKENFSPFLKSEPRGCMKRCLEMIGQSGCELSDNLIYMTLNDKTIGRPIEPSADFQKGIDAIDATLENGQPIILHVDYKNGTSSSRDTAGDHFITVVGRAIVDGKTYYHFYDPATSHMDIGTRGTNVLYVSGGFLTGAFLKPGNIKYNEYIVTGIRLNK